MVDIETFLTTLYVMSDDFCKWHLPAEALDSTAAVPRDAKRRGTGWLAGQADIGWSNRLGWYEGFHLLMCVNPIGVITGFGFGSAGTHDQLLASTLFAARQHPHARLPSAGLPAQCYYVADKARLSSGHTNVGKRRDRPGSSPHLIKPANENTGPKPCDAGWPASGKSLKPSMISC